MATPFLRTSDLARAVGIHPNTVRLYEKWGLIPAARRGQNGYRQFTEHHLVCLRLARLVYNSEYAGRVLRGTAQAIIQPAVLEVWQGALVKTDEHLARVRIEIEYAETAAKLLEHWAEQPLEDLPSGRLSISETARLLDVTVDVLRNWERNGLISVPRNRFNGYRLFGQKEISRLRVIRMLSRAGYSYMAILRMFIELDRGNTRNLRQVLDTPRKDEDIFMAADHWLTTLYEQEKQALSIRLLVEEQIKHPGSSEND